MPARQALQGRRLLTGALIATTIGLFVATGMLYVTQNSQRQLLASTIRTSGWVAYQAQLEFVKSVAALDAAQANPTPSLVGNLKLHLELLASRLPTLYDSDEGKTLANIDTFAPVLKQYEARIDGYIGRFPNLPQDRGALASELAGWGDDLAPLGVQLQKILETSIAYNDEIYRREREMANNSAIVPLMLMFVSGAGLVALLGVQAGRDRRRLNDVLAARRQQAASESNFRAAIEAMPAAIVIFDPATDEISFVNPSAASLLEKAPSDPEWRRLMRTVQDSSKATPLRGSRSVNIPFSRPGGEIISLRGTLCPILWKDKRQCLLALADVSKTRDAELQVMQAAKLATLGEMATAIAHETNQPLAVIKMAVANAQRLVASGAETEAVSAKLNRIGDQVDRIKRITDQVRRYGRMGSHLQEPFGLHHAIGLAIGFVAEQYRAAGIRLKIDLDLPADLEVAGEQTMFEQVVVNILVNARDAFEEARNENYPSLVVVHASTVDDCVIISVEDNAGGIGANILDKVFEPFATTKPAGKGTGLGLSMARSIVRDMKGDIQAVNVGTGARFSIRLPIAGSGDARYQAA